MSLELVGVDSPILVGRGVETRSAPPEATRSDGFGTALAEAVGQASALGHAAEAGGEALAVGRLDDVHGVMISAKEAEISLKLVASVRNRLLDAFHELWRMNV
ncbi:MAG: flagellar hook-basal body complex protein FliE [Myxococcales bacterium]|nr:flagellar hook-basal body complex protein FliE [Myxococcales bacterium]